MGGSDWRPLRGNDQHRLSAARLQAHHAVQWLARAARAYVPPQPDDGHTNLGWDGTFDGFTTHQLKNGMHLGLKIADLTLVLHGGDGTARVQTFSLNGRTEAQARQWLGEQRRGLPRRRAARHRQQASPDTIEHNRLLIAALDENCSAPPS
jgi:hypothetical protein